MPEVWARLSPDMDERLIDLALSRSVPSPLTITGHLFSSSALDKLLQHAHRWKYLDVYIDDDATMDRFAGHSAPLLEELRLDHLLPTLPTILFNGSAPMLRIVHIQNYGVQWSTWVLPNLHELALIDVQEDAPDVDTFLKLLSDLPQLTRLRVRHTCLTNSTSPQAQISLSYLSSLDLEYLGQGILKQLVERIHIPTTTKCRFSIELDDYESTSVYEQLEPIGQRLTKLANLSRGTRSTLTLSRERFGWTVRMNYEGEAYQLGALTVEVEAYPRSNIDIFEYFACQLGQGEPNVIPPFLHIINPPWSPNLDNQLEVLWRLHNHLPDTDKILIEDTMLYPHIKDGRHRTIEDAFNTLFPTASFSRPFPGLSALIIRELTHENWAHWILERQKGRCQQGGIDPLPLKTLEIVSGAIRAEQVKELEKLVSKLVLDRVEIK
ncbi:hypothetical protein FS837_003757 [Tulasnella sp. UAMH 9824]|nr:hypothetical protein FS837_003757 [Tulasnella sp. UAMH 9824]